MDKNDLIEVYETTNAGQADIIRMALNAEGIPCEAEGENQPFAGVLNVRLFVRAIDADRARKLIESHEPRQ